MSPNTNDRWSLFPHLEKKTFYKDPLKFTSSRLSDFKNLILELLEHNTSDIFMQPNTPIFAKINGDMYAVTDRAIDADEIKELLKWTSGRDTTFTDVVSGIAANNKYEIFHPSLKDARGAPARFGFRVNIFPITTVGGSSAQVVMRPIPGEPLLYSKIGLTRELIRMATPRDGIVYIAGATGSGKTTTIASIIRYILENDTPIKGNFITLEDPIEFTFETIISKHSFVTQSQYQVNFKTFEEANSEVMRRKPAGVLLGEMRNAATIAAGVELSLTGHPAFGTTHANNVAAIPRRLISRFPEAERATAIFDIVETSRFMMAQRLVKNKEGKLIAAREYIEFDYEVQETLINLSEMGRVTSCLRDLLAHKGHSFAKEANRLIEAGLITDDVAQSLIQNHCEAETD